MTGDDTARRPLYDDPAFFARYQQMRQTYAGLNEKLEQPAFTRMLPDVASRDALDLGCGSGVLVRWLASRGARHVLGIAPSERMLALAERHPPPARPVRPRQR